MKDKLLSSFSVLWPLHSSRYWSLLDWVRFIYVSSLSSGSKLTFQYLHPEVHTIEFLKQLRLMFKLIPHLILSWVWRSNPPSFFKNLHANLWCLFQWLHEEKEKNALLTTTVLGLLNSLVWYVPSLRYTRGLGWRMHCGAEVTESSTNKQHHHKPPSRAGRTQKGERDQTMNTKIRLSTP